METAVKTLLCARVHNPYPLKFRRPESEWVALFDEFFTLAATTCGQHQGTIIRYLGDGVMVSFDDGGRAVQAAIDLQEEVLRKLPHQQTGIACKIGIASGAVHTRQPNGHPANHLGTAIDIAERLSERARGKAILLHHPAAQPNSDLNRIHSSAGDLVNRQPEAYFVELPPCVLPGIDAPVSCHSIFWQTNHGDFLAASPIEEEDPGLLASEEERATFFGKVSAFKKERGFGFIQYYTDEHEYREIYFHMTYVVNQVPIQEEDHVQFVIKPGKEGRPQACAVLIMGSRLHGQVESLDDNGSGYVTIRNHASDLFRFYILPQQTLPPGIQVNDVVEFTVGSGSDMEGLVATDIVIFQGQNPPGHVGSGDNLTLGATEQAMVTVYFHDKGYGFAKCRRNNIYVHVSELTDPEHVPNPGDLIEFEVAPGRDGTYRANQVRLIMRKGLPL